MIENMNSQVLFIRREGDHSICKAQKVSEQRPSFIKEENAFRIRNEWYLKNKDGDLDSSGVIGDAYWILASTGEAKIIRSGVYCKYVVCNEDGTEEYGHLSEFKAA